MASNSNLLSLEEECQTCRHPTSVNFYIGKCRDCMRWPGVLKPPSYIHLIDYEYSIIKFKVIINYYISCGTGRNQPEY